MPPRPNGPTPSLLRMETCVFLEQGHTENFEVLNWVGRFDKLLERFFGLLVKKLPAC